MISVKSKNDNGAIIHPSMSVLLFFPFSFPFLLTLLEIKSMSASVIEILRKQEVSCEIFVLFTCEIRLDD